MIDLSSGFSGVRSQGCLPSSGAFAAASVIEYILNRSEGNYGQSRKWLSPMYLYFYSRGKLDYDSTRQEYQKNREKYPLKSKKRILCRKHMPYIKDIRSGISPAELCRAIEKHGTCFEDEYTYEDTIHDHQENFESMDNTFRGHAIGKFALQPPISLDKTAKSIVNKYVDKVDLMKNDPARWMAELNQGNPIILAIGVTSKIFDAKNFFIDDVSGEILGQQYVVLTGYDKNFMPFPTTNPSLKVEAFKIRNSWGAKWGADGQLWIPRDALEYLTDPENKESIVLRPKTLFRQLPGPEDEEFPFHKFPPIIGSSDSVPKTIPPSIDKIEENPVLQAEEQTPEQEPAAPDDHKTEDKENNRIEKTDPVAGMHVLPQFLKAVKGEQSNQEQDADSAKKTTESEEINNAPAKTTRDVAEKTEQNSSNNEARDSKDTEKEAIPVPDTDKNTPPIPKPGQHNHKFMYGWWIFKDNKELERAEKSNLSPASLHNENIGRQLTILKPCPPNKRISLSYEKLDSEEGKILALGACMTSRSTNPSHHADGYWKWCGKVIKSVKKTSKTEETKQEKVTENNTDNQFDKDDETETVKLSQEKKVRIIYKKQLAEFKRAFGKHTIPVFFKGNKTDTNTTKIKQRVLGFKLADINKKKSLAFVCKLKFPMSTENYVDPKRFNTRIVIRQDNSSKIFNSENEDLAQLNRLELSSDTIVDILIDVPEDAQDGYYTFEIILKDLPEKADITKADLNKLNHIGTILINFRVANKEDTKKILT